MSVAHRPRVGARLDVPLVQPPVIEGDCPACRGTFTVAPVPTAVGTVLQIPEHARVDRWTERTRCACSGWLARDPRPRAYFFVEGMRFL